MIARLQKIDEYPKMDSNKAGYNGNTHRCFSILFINNSQY